MSGYTENYYPGMGGSYGILGPESGFTDVLGIVCNGVRETDAPATASQMRPQDVITAKSLRVEVAQKSLGEERYAGEGADPNVLAAQTATVKATFQMPMLSPAHGYVQPVLARLWDLASMAHWGTASAAIGNVIAALPVGSSQIITDNPADFAGLATPFAVTVDGHETLVVVSVQKRQRSLTLAAPTLYAHAAGCLVVARPLVSGTGPIREPDFSLVSLREGLLAPALVNKITIKAAVNEPISVEVEVMALTIDRGIQPDARAARAAILESFAAQPPARVVGGGSVTLSPSSAASGAFGLSSALGDPLFGGYQGLAMPPLSVTGISITVDNHLTEIWTTHSLLQNGSQAQRQNSFPQALASDGRTISGKIDYTTAIDAWVVAERLPGPSALAGGGLTVDYGCCAVSMPEMAWSPSSGDAEAADKPSRSLDWTMVAEGREDMPPLTFTTQR
jgi:hypothetical protein